MPLPAQCSPSPQSHTTLLATVTAPPTTRTRAAASLGLVASSRVVATGGVMSTRGPSHMISQLKARRRVLEQARLIKRKRRRRRKPRERCSLSQVMTMERSSPSQRQGRREGKVERRRPRRLRSQLKSSLSRHLLLTFLILEVALAVSHRPTKEIHSSLIS